MKLDKLTTIEPTPLAPIPLDVCGALGGVTIGRGS
jgi:hypothetical protein